MTVGNIISMLKEISDNGNKKYPVTNFGGVFNYLFYIKLCYMI